MVIKHKLSIFEREKGKRKACSIVSELMSEEIRDYV